MPARVQPTGGFCKRAEEVASEWVIVVFERVAAGGGGGGEDGGLGDLMGVGFVAVVAVDVVVMVMVVWFVGVCGWRGGGSEGRSLEGWWGGSER